MHHLTELGHAPGDDTLPLLEQVLTTLEAEALPPVHLAPGAGNRGVDVLGGVHGIGADNVAVGGVERIERLAGLRAGEAIHDGCHRDSLVRSAAFSPTMMAGAFVLPRGTAGMTEASATRRFSTPWTRRSGPTTLPSMVPIAQVDTGW